MQCVQIQQTSSAFDDCCPCFLKLFAHKRGFVVVILFKVFEFVLDIISFCYVLITFIDNFDCSKDYDTDDSEDELTKNCHNKINLNINFFIMLKIAFQRLLYFAIILIFNTIKNCTCTATRHNSHITTQNNQNSDEKYTAKSNALFGSKWNGLDWFIQLFFKHIETDIKNVKLGMAYYVVFLLMLAADVTLWFGIIIEWMKTNPSQSGTEVLMLLVLIWIIFNGIVGNIQQYMVLFIIPVPLKTGNSDESEQEYKLGCFWTCVKYFSYCVSMFGFCITCLGFGFFANGVVEYFV